MPDVFADLLAASVVGIVALVFYLKVTRKTMGETITEIREATKPDEQII